MKNTVERRTALPEQSVRRQSDKMLETARMEDLAVFDKRFGWSLTQPLALLQVLPELKNCTILPAPDPCSHRELLLTRKKSTPVFYMDMVGEAIRHSLVDNIIPVIKQTMPWTESLLSVADAQFTTREPA